jgi:hypothetical protein
MGLERGAFLAVLRHPGLWFEAVRAWFGMRRIGGLSPSRVYLQWRTFTAYGDHLTTMSAHDLLNYLQWRREMRSERTWERVA